MFSAVPKFLRDAKISAALIGLLVAIPTTPLFSRLKDAGRLNDDADTEAYGTNVVPLKMGRAELRDGFIDVMLEVYSADAYFERVDALFIDNKEVRTGPPPSYERIHKLISKRLRKL